MTNSESQNKLKRLCESLKCETGYILSLKNKKPVVSVAYGVQDENDKNLISINTLVAKGKSLTEIKESRAFQRLSKEKGFRSFYQRQLTDVDDWEYHLIFLSKQKSIDPKSADEEINLLLQSIVVKSNSTDKISATPANNYNMMVEPGQILRETFSSIQSVLYSTEIKSYEYNFISDAVRNLFGYSPEEVYMNKLHILRSIHADDFTHFRKFLSSVQAGDSCTVEYRVKDRFGKEHWVRHSGIPIFKDNKVVRIVGEILDITEEKKVQLNLARSEEMFRALVDTADDLIFMLDGFGYISVVNKNGASSLGYLPEEMIGRHFLEFVAKEEGSKIASTFSQILNSSGVTTFETVFLNRFEKEIIFEINAKPMITDGEISGMLSIGRNISSRKTDEQKIKDLNTKLIEANRIISIERERARHKITVLEELNKLKSEFISNVSHELRTPLASIVGFAETILSDKDLPEETVNEFTGIILTEGKRLAKLINDLLDFSKLESGDEELNRAPVNVVDVLQLVTQTFRKSIEEKKLVVSEEFPESEVVISADRDRITKVFSNLISNAVKFTGNGGRINFIVHDFGKEVEIAISDTGVGISEKELPGLFQKFSKVQKPGQSIGGTGFGLVTVKQIIDLHKGFIRVKSELNKGTTFIIRLPK